LERLSWLQGVAEELPLEADSQDVVISSLVRE
jgi:ubiquinone/menaquinone biosynthesis C-methylase UbiE